MPSFKTKTTKKIKINKKSITTLDGKHGEFLNEFNKDETYKIPKLRKECEELTKRLEISKELTIEQIMDIKDEIKDIKEEIKILKSKKKKYYLDNSKYIFDYFENKKNISIGETTKNKNKILLLI